MPENSEAPPQPVPAPSTQEVPKPKTDIKFYAVCAIALALAITAYAYFTRYSETKTVLDVKETALTTATSSYKSLESKFNQYKIDSESKTSYIKKPFMFNGALVSDTHGNATYVKIFLKDKKLTNIGSTTTFNEVSQSVTVTKAVTIITHETKDEVKGSKTNGIAYISLPSELFTGSLPRIGAGADHNFIFGTAVGFEGGTKDIKDPIKNAYVDFHIGLQTP
jgi:hypothetical protein